jgi:hypothetical protein
MANNEDVMNAVRVLRFAFPMSLRDGDAVGHAQNLALAVDLVTRALEKREEVLRNVLWVTRGATDSPLEDAFGHALSNIEMRVEEALGIGPEDEVEHDEVKETP